MKKRTLYKNIFKIPIQPVCMTKFFSIGASFLLVLLVLASCFSGQKSNVQVLEIGKVYPKIFCAADSNQSYSLFLPSNYDKNTPSPVLILFDSHGDGLLPVNLFSTDELIAWIRACDDLDRLTLAHEMMNPEYDVQAETVTD
jgi:hypothetical protein